MGLAGALCLSDLDDRLEALAHAGIVRIDRHPGLLMLRQEHRAAGEVAVVGNSQHPTAELRLIGLHERPQILHIF